MCVYKNIRSFELIVWSEWEHADKVKDWQGPGIQHEQSTCMIGWIWMNISAFDDWKQIGLGLITKISALEIFIIQGPKFVSDEEIERIKAKIEEDNRAIAALESKKYGEKGEILITVLTCWHAGMP